MLRSFHGLLSQAILLNSMQMLNSLFKGFHASFVAVGAAYKNERIFNMKKSGAKGAALITTLVIMVIISVFLMSAVYKTQAGIFATKRVVQEIKSYWAARAGFAVAANGILKNIYWPFAGAIGRGGGYEVSRDGDIVIGRDNDTGSEFKIYSISKFSKGKGEGASVHSSASQIPYPNMQGRMTPEKLQNGDSYFLSVGSCGTSVCGLEMIYHVSQSADEVSSSAAAYAGGAIDASVSTKLVIQQKDGARPCLISKSGGITISGIGGAPGKYSSGSLDIGEGCIFTSGNLNLNGKAIQPSFSSNNLLSYGVNVYPSAGVSRPDIKKPTADPAAVSLPAGTYCFIEMPSEYTDTEFNTSVRDCVNFYPPDCFYRNYYKEGKSLNLDSVQIPYGKDAGAPASHEQIVEHNDNFESLFARAFESKSAADIKGYIKNGYNSNTLAFNDDGFVQCGFLDSLFSFFGGSDDSPSEDLDSMDDEEVMGIFLPQYKDYLSRKLNVMISGYRATADLGSKTFEPFFIPPGVAGTSKDNELISISFDDLTRSRVFGNLIESLEYAENSYDSALRNRSTLEKLISSISGGLFKSQKVLAAENEVKDLKKQVALKLREIQENHGFISENIYYDSTDHGSGYFTILKPASKYNVDDYGKFDQATLDALKFNSYSSELSLELKKSLTTKASGSSNYFNFATYERGAGQYRIAENRRSVVKIGSADGSRRQTIASGNINIKGVITGAGQLIADEDISVEAGTKLNAGEENCLALCGRNVNLTKISADNGAITGAGDVSSTSYDSASKTILKMLNQSLEKPIDLNNQEDLKRLSSMVENGEIDYYSVYTQKDSANKYYYDRLRGIDASAGQAVETDENTGDYKEIDVNEQTVKTMSSYNQMMTQIQCWATGSTYTVVSNFKGVIYADNNINIDGGATNPSFALEGTMIAMNGVINMKNLYEAVIVYNPELSKIIYSNSDTSFSNDLVVKMSGGEANGSGVHNEGTLKAFNRI